MPDWSEDEVTDARRDVVALMRAGIDGRHGDIAAILDGAGERGTRGVAEALLGMAADLLVRLSVAVPVIENETMRKLVITTDTDTFLAQPEIRAAIEANIKRYQGENLGEG